MRQVRCVLLLTAALLLWAACSGEMQPAVEREDGGPGVQVAVGESVDDDMEQPTPLWEREEEPPAELDGAPAIRLLYYPYVNSLKYGYLCGEEVSETYPENVILPHGLTADSDLPDELVAFLGQQGEGLTLLDFEYRWFEEERIVLFTRTRHGPDHSVVAAVAEIVLLEGDPPAWGTWSAGGRYICME